MGKNHRHKKQLKSEKAKIKLKNSKTKFLPKGQNISDLSFKIKPIVIPEQLKSKDSEVVSSRKLNLKEILNRLNHYNSTVKQENCQQLRELISTENVEFLRQNLSNILKSACPLILDIEHKVRKEVIKLLNEILQLNTSSNITSFFGILSSFLKCAMTHINQNVQEDSLLLLDALLLHVPDLVAKNSNLILMNFFTLISKFKSNSKHARTIAENLNSKYTGVKWRIEVLLRLEKMFEAIYYQSLSNSNNEVVQERIIDTTKTCFAPIYVDKYENISTFDKNQLYETNHIEYYIDTLIPLLQEAWLEVAPSNITNIIAGKLDYTVLKHETACTLHCTLKILYILDKLTDSVEKENSSALRSKLKNNTSISLLNITLLSFPYTGKIEKGREVFGINNDPRCLEENLLICHLFSVLNRNIRGNELIKNAEKILEYLNFCLSHKEYIKDDQIKKLLLSIIKVILKKNLLCWKRANLQVDLLIENILNYCLNGAAFEDETELLLLLCDEVRTNSVKQKLLVERSCKFLLTHKISIKVLNLLLLMVKREVNPLQECLRQNLASILDNIQSIKVIGLELQVMKVVHILSLFYYTPLNNDDKEVLRKFGQNYPQYDSAVVSIIER